MQCPQCENQYYYDAGCLPLHCPHCGYKLVITTEDYSDKKQIEVDLPPLPEGTQIMINNKEHKFYLEQGLVIKKDHKFYCIELISQDEHVHQRRVWVPVHWVEKTIV